MSDTCWRHARRGTTYAHLATGIIESDHRLVELGELREVQNPHSSAGQHRLFIKGGES